MKKKTLHLIYIIDGGVQMLYFTSVKSFGEYLPNRNTNRNVSILYSTYCLCILLVANLVEQLNF